jgi:hypothetical protein
MPNIFDKLNLKKRREILVLDAPDSFESALESLSDIRVLRRVTDAKDFDFVLIFVTRQIELNEFAKTIVPRVAGDAVLWFAYPKGTSKRYTCDFNRDNGWEILVKSGFDTVRQVAIDEDWSALRFRRVEFIKHRS